MLEELVAVDLFAGCGGGSMGFIRRGFRVGAAVEIDPDSAEAFLRNTGISVTVDDVRRVTGPGLLRATGVAKGETALLFGCPPCQSFSIMRRGTHLASANDKRNELPSEYLRLVKAIRPRHIAFENVPGMITGRWERHFRQLTDGLTAMGYRYDWRIVDAADYGVPQFRKRLLLIGSRVGPVFFPEPTHSTSGRDGTSYHATVRGAIGHLQALEAGGIAALDIFHRARRHSSLAIRRLQAVPEGGGRRDLPPSLRLKCHAGHNGHNDVYGRMRWDRPAPTLTSGCTNVTRGRFGHPEQDRAITLREAMLLQTFPPEAILHGTEDKMALQVGNAIPTLLAERVADSIIMMEKHHHKPRRVS